MSPQVTYLVHFLAKNECPFLLPRNTDHPWPLLLYFLQVLHPAQLGGLLNQRVDLRGKVVSSLTAGEHLGSLLFCVDSCELGRQ